MNDSRKIILVLLVVIIVILIFAIKKIKSNNSSGVNQKTLAYSEEIEVVPTMNDTISSDTAWCGVFQLVWNDFVNEFNNGSVTNNTNLAMIDNLNKQDFNEDSISDEYYYKTCGLKTLDLKNKIESEIKTKFNETTSILNDISWDDKDVYHEGDNLPIIILYAMLKRDFSYENEFDQLENGNFAGKYDDTKYFGINDSTDKKTRTQVDVLYYDSISSCAVALNTVEGDRVIVCKGTENNQNFEDIFNEINEKSNQYAGDRAFGKSDELQIPEININAKKDYDELENVGKDFLVSQAIQNIQMQLDKKGGSVKSEAVMQTVGASLVEDEQEARYFCFTDEFTIFIIESGKDKPYFACHVSDITKFQ